MALTPSGRPKRRSRRVVDYTETEDETPFTLEKYLERVQKEAEQRSASSKRSGLKYQFLPSCKRSNVIMMRQSALRMGGTHLSHELSSFLLYSTQLHSSSGCSKSSGRSDQPEAAECVDAAEALLQPSVPGGVSSGSSYAGVQGDDGAAAAFKAF